MMDGSFVRPGELRSYGDIRLLPLGLVRGAEKEYPDVIAWRLVDDGNAALVLVRERWSTPVCYEVVRLTPIDNEDTSSFDNPLYLFPPGAPRKSLEGVFKVAETLLSFEPGRHRGMVREAARLLRQTAPVDWSAIKTLDGIYLTR